jgi:membrane protease YdiL (CAAX protease family)
MLDPSWALTRPLLWLALLGLLVLLVARTIRKDRRQYQRFTRYRTTARRQAMFRKWLRESFLSFGGLSVAILLLAGGYVGPLLRELSGWPVVRDIRAADPAVLLAVVVGLVIAMTVLTAIGARAARSERDIVTIGDIQAILPRNRQELMLGALLSVNAGLVEELLFRLALPALVFGATGSAVAAVLVSVLLFGALHLYQGPWGIVGTAVVGVLMIGAYAISGTIVVPIILHVLFDLRSLVLIPVAVFGVHRIDGRAQPIVARGPAPTR